MPIGECQSVSIKEVLLERMSVSKLELQSKHLQI